VDENTLLDVRWSDQSRLVSLNEFKDWFRHYRVEFLVQSIHDPDERAMSSGAVAIMRLGSVRDVTLNLEIR
jgi:hypothetical protein